LIPKGTALARSNRSGTHFAAIPVTRSSAVTGGEVALMALVLMAVAAVVYGPHVANGGMYIDDWDTAATFQFADSPRYWSTVSELADVFGGRPLLALLLPIPHALFGIDPAAHLALGLALSVVTSLCLYAVLRVLGLAPVHSAAIAVLGLLFPWSDATRLWATASINNVPVCLFLLGLLVAIKGLSHRGGQGLAMHAGAVTLYVLSVLTYEVVAIPALLAGFLYIGRAPLRTVAQRWLADVVAVLGALTYSLATTVSRRHVGSFGERLGDLGDFARESLQLLALAFVPADSLSRPLMAFVLVLVGLVVGLAVVRLRRRPDPPLATWMGVAGVALATIAAAYVVFLGSNLHPRDTGIGSRINLFAGLAFCVFVYALLAISGRLLLGDRALATGLTLIAAGGIAVGYSVRVREHAADWERASDLQQKILSTVDREVGSLPARSTVLTYRHPAQTAPEVPVFNEPYDLDAALELRSGDAELRAYPLVGGVRVRCLRDGAVVEGSGNFGRHEVEYARMFAVDVAEPDGTRVGGQRACRRAFGGALVAHEATP
jgi:hypothetical protein